MQSIILFSALSLLLPVALAKTIDIDVGKDGLVFAPDSITAAKGDTLDFHFYPDEHSVAQSTFDKPCVPSNGAIFSGVVKSMGKNPMVFQVTVNDTNPIWIYCSYDNHCNAGMAMVVNPPNGKTLDAYKVTAASAQPQHPNGIAGGIFVEASSSHNSTSGSSTSASSSSTSSMSSSTSTSTGSKTSSASTTGSATAGSTTSPSTSPTSLASRLEAVGWLAALGLGGFVAGMV